eukprot:scaffold1379_cov390-Prasinococcus_capsulatus_cf.AAC.8
MTSLKYFTAKLPGVAVVGHQVNRAMQSSCEECEAATSNGAVASTDKDVVSGRGEHCTRDAFVDSGGRSAVLEEPPLQTHLEQVP